MGSISQPRSKIAIIGSGCAGLGAAWALKSTEHDVHIFEKNSRLGGHTNTQPWRTDSGETLQVDTGFIVMNSATYPNFMRFLKEVGVDIVPTEMTFGVSRDAGAFEWSGKGRGIFAQRRNLLRWRHWRLIFDIVRFNQFALDLLAKDEADGIERLGSPAERRRYAANMSIGQYLNMEGYSQAFRDDYLIPMTAAVWSTSPDKASLDFPAKTLIRFMWNHHLLSTLATRPPWLTIPGGSQKYIDAVVKRFPEDRLHVHLSSQILDVQRSNSDGEGVQLSWFDATAGRMQRESFTHVIFACHGDEVLPILTDKTVGAQLNAADISASRNSRSKGPPPGVSRQEYEIFQSFQTTQNTCYLHSDLSLMPQRRACWTSWNYLTISRPPSHAKQPSSSPSPPGAAVSLTYCMNILQHLPEEKYGPILVTMNPPHPPAPSLTQGEYHYTHPLYTAEAVAAQDKLQTLQGKRGVSFCGAWTKYGFHEDGFSSGLRVAMEHLGAELPFDFVDSTFSRGHRPELCWQDHVVRVVLLAVMIWIRILEIVMGIPGLSPLVEWVDGIWEAALDAAEKMGLLRDPA